MAFAYSVLIASFGIAFAICIPLGILMMIYVIPYALWVGNQLSIGKHKDKKDEKFSATLKHATQLYKAWLTRTEPTFK